MACTTPLFRQRGRLRSLSATHLLRTAPYLPPCCRRVCELRGCVAVIRSCDRAAPDELSCDTSVKPRPASGVSSQSSSRPFSDRRSRAPWREKTLSDFAATVARKLALSPSLCRPYSTPPQTSKSSNYWETPSLSQDRAPEWMEHRSGSPSMGLVNRYAHVPSVLNVIESFSDSMHGRGGSAPPPPRPRHAPPLQQAQQEQQQKPRQRAPLPQATSALHPPPSAHQDSSGYCGDGLAREMEVDMDTEKPLGAYAADVAAEHSATTAAEAAEAAAAVASLRRRRGSATHAADSARTFPVAAPPPLPTKQPPQPTFTRRNQKPSAQPPSNPQPPNSGSGGSFVRRPPSKVVESRWSFSNALNQMCSFLARRSHEETSKTKSDSPKSVGSHILSFKILRKDSNHEGVLPSRSASSLGALSLQDQVSASRPPGLETQAMKASLGSGELVENPALGSWKDPLQVVREQMMRCRPPEELPRSLRSNEGQTSAQDLWPGGGGHFAWQERATHNYAHTAPAPPPMPPPSRPPPPPPPPPHHAYSRAAVEDTSHPEPLYETSNIYDHYEPPRMFPSIATNPRSISVVPSVPREYKNAVPTPGSYSDDGGIVYDVDQSMLKTGGKMMSLSRGAGGEGSARLRALRRERKSFGHGGSPRTDLVGVLNVAAMQLRAYGGVDMGGAAERGLPYGRTGAYGQIAAPLPQAAVSTGGAVVPGGDKNYGAVEVPSHFSAAKQIPKQSLYGTLVTREYAKKKSPYAAATNWGSDVQPRPQSLPSSVPGSAHFAYTKKETYAFAQHTDRDSPSITATATTTTTTASVRAAQTAEARRALVAFAERLSRASVEAAMSKADGADSAQSSTWSFNDVSRII